MGEKFEQSSSFVYEIGAVGLIYPFCVAECIYIGSCGGLDWRFGMSPDISIAWKPFLDYTEAYSIVVLLFEKALLDDYAVILSLLFEICISGRRGMSMGRDLTQVEPLRWQRLKLRPCI